MKKAAHIKGAKPTTKLLPVPFSTRPDRIERGVRILRALRLGLSEPASTKHEQPEFTFARDCR